MKKTLKKIALIGVMAAAVVFATATNGKLGLKELVYTITLPLALVVSCKNEPETTVNKPPVAHAGSAQTVRLRDNLTVELDGSQSSDPDGTIAAYAWVLKDAPDDADKTGVTIANDPANTGKAAVTGIRKAGAYVFELTVTDNEGAAGTATVTVTVVENIAPEALAGVEGGVKAGDSYEFDFTLPGNRSVTLKGGGTDTDGAVEGYAWECTKKPEGADVPAFNATAQNPTASGFNKLGGYEFSLKVRDNDGAESAASVVKVSLFRTASATVEVPNISFSSTPTLDFNQAYTGHTSDFPSGCITYELKDNKDNNWYSTDTDFNGIVSNTYGNAVEVTFTQTFYYNDQEVDGRSFTVMTTSITFK